MDFQNSWVVPLGITAILNGASGVAARAKEQTERKRRRVTMKDLP
jgi:hypothetical protein